jgi:hypothetical protein
MDAHGEGQRESIPRLISSAHRTVGSRVDCGPVRALGSAFEMVRPERLELPTLCSEGRCSIQLSYGRVDVFYGKFGSRS